MFAFFSKEHLFKPVVFAQTLQKEHCNTVCFHPMANQSSLFASFPILTVCNVNMKEYYNHQCLRIDSFFYL